MGGDGKGDGKEEVCVEEMKACAADKECSMIHEKLQAAMKKEGGYGGKGGDGKYDDKKEGGYGGDKKEGGKEDGEKKEYPPKKEGGYGGDKKGYSGYGKQGKSGRQLHQHLLSEKGG